MSQYYTIYRDDMSTDNSCIFTTNELQLHQTFHGSCNKMKDEDDDKLKLAQLQQAFHGSFKDRDCSLFSPAGINSAQDDNYNGEDLLQLHFQDFHGSSAHRHAVHVAPHCGPLPQAYSSLDDHFEKDDQDAVAAFGKVSSEDHDVLQLHKDLDGSSDHPDVAESHCSHLTQSLFAQAKSSSEDDQDAAAADYHDQDDKPADVGHLHGSYDPASHEGLHESFKHHASSVQHRHGKKQVTSINEADHKCEAKVDDHQLHQALLHGSSKLQGTLCGEDHTLRRRCSLAQAFSTEDYNDLLNILSHSTSAKPSASLVSEKNHHKFESSSCRFNTRSPLIQSLAYNDNSKDTLTGDVDNFRSATRCSSSSSFKRDDFTNKAYMHDEYNYKEPIYNYTISSSSHKYPMKEQYSYIMRGVGLAFKWGPIRNLKWRSPLGGQLHKTSSARVWVQEDGNGSNLDTSSIDFITKVGTLGSSLSGYSYNSDSTSFNTSGSLSNSIATSSRDSQSSASSFTFSHDSSKSADKKLPQEPKMKKLQSLFHGKNFNVQLFLRQNKLNGQQSNRVNGRNPRFNDRNCNVSSFYEEPPKHSIKDAIAHCKHSMATTNNSSDLVLP